MDRRRAAGALLALAACIACTAAAPTLNEHTSLDLYDGSSAGCYYNFQHYGEGDRIMTNEPCLNCTCHNRMLMCYLRVCPFTKPIGQDCTVEKRADQCCPIVTCPDVPVDLLTSTSTTSPAEYGATGVGKPDKYGCSINGKYFSEGSKVPSTPNKPCEHCYCIRNMTTCVMQECTLHVDGCTPIYHKDVCCPVRYSCDHLDDEILLLDDMTTTVRPTPGFLLTTTISSQVTQMTQDCVHDDKIFADGALIKTEKACEHCYCMKGDIVCVVQECGTPMENEGKNCTSLPPREGQCCPDTYICEGDEIATESLELFTTEIVQDEVTTLTPPRRHGVEGSGYRNEPDNISYTPTSPTEAESEGSGHEQKLETAYDSNEILSTTEIHEYVTTTIPITEETKHKNEITEEESYETPQEDHEKTTTVSAKQEMPVTIEEVQTITDEDHELDHGITSISPLEHTEFVTKTDKEDIGETTQKEVFLTEENVSTTTSELGSKTKITTETAKQDLGTTISIEEKESSITTSSTIFEEDEGVTTDKQHDITSIVIPEKQRPQTGEYSPSTQSTPFLEEVEKVTTETQEQHIVTDHISEIDEFGPHKFASTISVPEAETNKDSDTISGDNTLPDTESHEYIPIATSAPIGDESEKGTTLQEDAVTSDFTEEEMNKPHKYIPSATNSILEDNEFITTETNRESFVSKDIPEMTDTHKDISGTTAVDTTSEAHKLTTEVFEHEIVTDRIRKDDDSYQHTLTTTNIIPITEESSVIEKEEDEKAISSASTEIDKTNTDHYIVTTIRTPYLDDHKTTMNDYGDVITKDDSKDGNIVHEKDFSSTVGYVSSKSDEQASTELNKYETSTSKSEDKEFYEPHKLHSTSAIGIEEDYITTTEYTGKDEEFISQEISQEGTKPSENTPHASSTPFLEEIEKVTPEVSGDSISGTVAESDIPVKHLPSTDTILTLDEEVTTIVESDNIVDVTTSSGFIDKENLGSIVPEKTTQGEPSESETTIPSTRVTDERQSLDMDSITTEAHPYSTSSAGTFITKEDQFSVTTEPSFRKEDNIVETTSELSREVTTSTPNIESTRITAPTGLPHEIPTISVLPEYTHESHKPVSSQETTVEINTETVSVDINNLPVSIDETSIVSTTHSLDKIDLLETSTINPGENEINEDILSSAGRIPGEGDCLLNGVTYINESAVPSTNKCHSGCRCLSSIITCDPIICSPPPEYMDNCQPTYDSAESCCPTYVCDQVRETLPPLPYKHVTTPETPKQSIAIECHGDECEISEDKKQPTESSELCSTGSCSTDSDHKQETSKCGPEGCTVPISDKTELCIDGKCEQPIVQVHNEELCEGTNCKSIPETLPNGLQQDSKSQEVSSIPCTGESCTTTQKSTNIISESYDTALPCKEQNGCLVNQDNIGQECTDDSCRRKETINIEHKPLCSGVDCAQNQNLPQESTIDDSTHHSTYAPIVEQSTDTETTPNLSVFPDIVTKPVKQHATEDDLIPNKMTVTELPELITSSMHPIETQKEVTPVPDIFITESQEPFTNEPQKPIGESHTLETKLPVIDEQMSQTEQPSTKLTTVTVTSIEYEASTGIPEDKYHKEEEIGITTEQPKDGIIKPQDQTILPGLPMIEVEKETKAPENVISNAMDTHTKPPGKDEIATTIFDTLKHEVSTAISQEYSTSVPNIDNVESGFTTPTRVSVTYESSSEVSSITQSPDLLSHTEKSIEVTKTEETNNQELTTAKVETENDNDYTTLVNNLEQVNTNTDLPYSHISEHVEDSFENEKPSTTAKPRAESYDTTTQKLSVIPHETTEPVLTEGEHTDSVATVTPVIDSEIHLTETEDSRTDSPGLITTDDKLSTEVPYSHVTELEVHAMEDEETKIKLPTFESHEKETETDSPSAVTDSEVHIPKIDVTKITLPVTTIEEDKIKADTPASLVTETETHGTPSEEINTSLPTFVTEGENILSEAPVAPVTEIGLQKDKTDLYVTESESLEDERKTTLKQEEDYNKIDEPEPVDYVTHVDETRTTLPTTYIDKNEKFETELPKTYVTEAAPHSIETEKIKSTLPSFTIKEETIQPEYSSSQMTEKGTFTSETDEKRTTLQENITEQEKAYTETPASQITNIEIETTMLDETRTTSPTLVTGENVEPEFPVTVVTELKPHPDEITETKTTTPTYSTEEEKIIKQTPSSQATQAEEDAPKVDETKTTSAAFITTEQTIEEAVPTSPVTESEANLSTLEETRVTPTYITEEEKIKEEAELPVSLVPILELHEDKVNELTTILPASQPETETATSYITASEVHANDADQINTLPVTVSEKIESQFSSTHVTESGVYATDLDVREPTLSEIVSETEASISPVTESGLQANDHDETRTSTPSFIIQDDATKTDSQSLFTEPEVYASTIYDAKTTTLSSIIKEEKTDEERPISQVTQSVIFETETKVPTFVTVNENTISEFTASTEKEIKLQTNEVEETQTTTTAFAEEEKIKLQSPLSHVKETKDHTGKLDETKTTLPVSVPENENVATESSHSQGTESHVYVTEIEETRTTSSVPHLSEESTIKTESTPLHLPESDDYITKEEETRTTLPELSITEEQKTGSESPVSYVTDAEIHGTLSDETNSHTFLPDIEKHETEAPVYHISESEAHATLEDESKTTIPSFVVVEEDIKTEAPAVPGVTEIIPDKHKPSTLSEHVFTESEVHSTEPSTIPEISLKDTDNVIVEKQQDNGKLTTELYDSDTITHIKPDATSSLSLSEHTTEIKYIENVITGEEVKLTTESSEVESTSSIGISEHGTTQGDGLETKVPEANLINTIQPDLHVTEGHLLSTVITEATYIGEDTPLPQDYSSKLPELLPVTTVSAVSESEKIDIPSMIEDIQKPITSSPDVQDYVTQQVVTKDTETYVTKSEELGTEQQIVTEKQIVSTELLPTISSHTDIPVQHDLAQPTIPVITQDVWTSSEPDAPYQITLAPESLTTNLLEVSQSNPDEHHINKEEQSTIKPTIDYIDSSTIKSDITTISQEQYFTEKQEPSPIEHDSSTVSQEITTKKPGTTEIDSIITTLQEETTEHEQIKDTSVPVSENTETLPDVIELEEHTHKTLLDITTVTSIDDQSIIQSTSEKVELEHQTPEQSTKKASDEELGIHESTAISEDTSTPFYEVEKSTAALLPVEQTSEEIQSVYTTPATSQQEETSISIPTQISDIEKVSVPEASVATDKPFHDDKAEPITTLIDEITSSTLKPTSPTVEKESPAPIATTSTSEMKPSDTSTSKVPKPVTSATQPADEISSPPEDEHFPPSGSSGYGGEPDYVEEDQAFGPGTCRYGGKVYVSAQQIPRDDPCDFCFCFRSDIICLQQSCPPPIHGCHEEPIQGFCCPRYECPVSMATTLNVTTTTTTTTTTLPPHFPTHSYKGAAQRRGCQIKGHTYKVGEFVRASSGPCLHCTCGGDGQMKCDPKACTPEPMLRQMIAAAVSAKRRR